MHSKSHGSLPHSTCMFVGLVTTTTNVYKGKEITSTNFSLGSGKHDRLLLQRSTYNQKMKKDYLTHV